MKLQMVQNALKQKNIKYEYTEEDDCGSLDFMFRGLRFHVWEYHDEVWGAETNIYEAAEARISRAITKKKLLQRFCHGRI